MSSTKSLELNREKDFDSFSKHLAPVGLQRFIQGKEGTKQPKGKWITHTPDGVGQNSLIKSGDGLMIWDVDDESKLTDKEREWLDENPTLTVQSPHAERREGHYYFSIDNYDGREKFQWGELKYGSLAVTPGSELTECKHGCCTPDNPGRYVIRDDRPLQTVTVDELPIETNTESTIDTQTWEKDEWEIAELPDGYDGESVRNEFGMSVQQVRQISRTIDNLCRYINPENTYPSPSEGDFKFVQSLYYWGFNEKKCKGLLRYYRPRKKIKKRPDYVHNSVKNAKENIIDRMDSELAFALMKSCGDEGPAAGFTTLFLLNGEIKDEYHEWTTTTEIAENSRYDYRRVLRGLHILADAGRIERKGNPKNELEWRVSDSEKIFPIPPHYSS